MSMSTDSETPEEMSARHKKEVKSFDGEKRAAIKNAKSRGKKAKNAASDVEFKYQGLERDLKERHNMQLEQLTSGDGDGDDGTKEKADDVKEDAATSKTSSAIEEQQTNDQIEEAKRQKAVQKKVQKKNARRQKELDREKRINEENSSAGPSRRQMEIEALQKLYLHPRKLDMQEVEADGNCLFRAVGMQCGRLGLDAGDLNSDKRHGKIRELCADVLLGPNRGEYEPFAEFGAGHVSHSSSGGHHPATYEEYVNNMRSSSTWGGQLELRALSEGLKCPIVVFSADGPPLTMGAEYAPSSEKDTDDEDWDKKKMLLLSFHRHYYALGEHYNSIIHITT